MRLKEVEEMKKRIIPTAPVPILEPLETEGRPCMGELWKKDGGLAVSFRVGQATNKEPNLPPRRVFLSDTPHDLTAFLTLSDLIRLTRNSNFSNMGKEYEG
jgi:hypothetical protein